MENTFETEEISMPEASTEETTNDSISFEEEVVEGEEVDETEDVEIASEEESTTDSEDEA